jgi:hypothetical protein
LAVAGALGYRKLIDARAGFSTMCGKEVLALSSRVRSYHAHHEQTVIGAQAVVTAADQTWRYARLLGALAVAERPMKVFENYGPARRWIDEQHAVQASVDPNEPVINIRPFPS